MRTFQDSRPQYGQDPYVATTSSGSYFIESQDEARITIRPLAALHSTPQVLWDDPTEQQVWAPELHHIDGRYYIYYSASDGHNACHRNRVLGSDSPLGPFRSLGPIGPDIWGIDLTTFQHNGYRYAVWSGWEENNQEFPQNLYIGYMHSPKTVLNRTLLVSPTLSWEKSHAPILEGPQAFYDKGMLALTYSANASWTQDYCTALLALTGSDPLNPRHWEKWPNPLALNVGHGHRIEGTDLFVYHKKLSPLPGWSDRVIDIMEVQELLGVRC